MFDSTSTAFIIVGDDGVCMVFDLFEKLMLSGDGVTKSPTLSLITQFRERSIANSEATNFCDVVSSAAPSNSTGSRLALSINPRNERLFRTVCLNIDPKYALPWTSNLDTFGGQLNLNHGTAGQRRRIVALDICPLDRIIVTGCDDGLAQLWRYGEKIRDASKVEQGPGGEHAAISTRYSKSFFDQISGDRTDMESKFRAICRLEGHVCAVMDTRFSHSGDRVITGSMDDGTVRLWSFSSDFTKTEHILISLADDDDEGNSQFGIQSNGPFRGRLNNRMNRVKRVLYSLCWSSNDAFILALHSISSGSTARDDKSTPSRLKVFDSQSGNLIRTINVSTQRTELLFPHPLNPNIVVTAGSEGIIVVWDLSMGDILDRHELVTPDITDFPEGVDAETKVEVADACFSEDGDKFAVTDNFGRLSLFCLGEVSSKYSGKYPEQYFSTDYHALLFEPEGDPRGYDAGTHELLNEANPGLLCRYDGTPYEDQPNRKLFNVAFDMSTTLQQVAALIEASKNFDKVLERSHNALVKLKLKMGSSSQQMLTRNSWSATQHASNIRSAQGGQIVDSFRSRSQSSRTRTLYIEPSSESDSSFEEIRLSQARGDRNQRATERASRLSSYRRNSNRSRTVQSESEEDEESLVSESDGEYHNHSGSSTSDEDKAGISESEVSNEDDYVIPSEGGGGISRSRSSKRLRVSKAAKKDKNISTKKTSKASRSKQKQTVASKDTLKPWSRLNGFRTVPIGAPVDRLWLQQYEPNDLHYCPQCGDSVMYLPQGHLEHLHSFPEASAPPWLSFALKWPVVECKILSISYDFPSQQEYKYCASVIARITLMVTGVPIKWAPSGSIPSGTDALMWKEFAQLRATRHSAQRNDITFEVSLRSCSAPDFLVPAHLYRRAASIKWRPGLRFKTYFKEDNGGLDASQRSHHASPARQAPSSLPGPVIGSFSSQMTIYSGKVVQIRESNNMEWPRSPWESLVVIWTARNGEVITWNEAEAEINAQDRISPWDAYLVAGGDEASSSNALGVATMQFQLPSKVASAVLDAIDEFIDGEDAITYAPFSVPVDPELFTDYYCLIPLPMDLSLIKKRIQSNFYRQVEGLQSDISLICSNCMQYNREDAPIVPLAQKLTCSLLSVIEKGLGDSSISTSLSLKDSTVEPMSAEVLVEEQPPPRSPPGASLMIHIRRDSGRTTRRSASLTGVEPSEAIRESASTEVNSSARPNTLRGAQTRLDRKIQKEASDSESDKSAVLAKRTRGSMATRSAAKSNKNQDAELESDDGSEYQSESSGSENERFLRGNRSLRIRASLVARKAKQETNDSLRALSVRRTSRSSAGRRYNDADDSDGGSDDIRGVRGKESGDSDGSRGLPTRKRARNNASASEGPITRSNAYSASESSGPGKPKLIKSGDLYDDILWPLYNRLLEQDPMEIFALPVTDEIAPGYSAVISRPTDLSRIKTHLESRKYRTIAQFKEEVLRMFDNCIAYNEPDSVFVEEASRQRESFEGELRSLE
jgi:hypothetical protein